MTELNSVAIGKHLTPDKKEKYCMCVFFGCFVKNCSAEM